MVPSTTVLVWLIAAVVAIPAVLLYDCSYMKSTGRSGGVQLHSDEWRRYVSFVCRSRGIAIVVSCVLAGLLPLVLEEFVVRHRFLEAMADSGSLYPYTSRSPEIPGVITFNLLAMLSAALLLYWISAWLMAVFVRLHCREESFVLIYPSRMQIRVGAGLHATICFVATSIFRW